MNSEHQDGKTEPDLQGPLGADADDVFQKLSTGFFASAGQIMWNRFTGPGKIALQSMYYHMDGGE